MASKFNNRKKWLSITAGLLLVTVIPSYAVDGVIEINQAGALAGGITPGDTAGFPVSVSQSGSYRLTGDLSVPDLGTTVIEVTGDNVTIDLNGFAVTGTNDCSNLTFGPGHGIDSIAGSNTAVLNGTVMGMGSRGIQGATHIEGVRVLCNGEGIFVSGRPARITGNTISLNGEGITSATALDMAIISGNVVKDNNIDVGRGVVERNMVNGSVFCIKTTGVIAHNWVNGCGDGINAGPGSTVIGNTVRNNSRTGIGAGHGSTVKSNTVFNNDNRGIVAGDGSTVKDNSLFNNGGNGITCGNGCTLIGNTLRNNDGAGISTGALSGYANNVFSGNTRTISVFPTEIGSNVCNGDAVCP